MRTITTFEAGQELIIVSGSILGPASEAPLRLVIDTGSSETLISPNIGDLIGYSARDAERPTSVYSAIGKEQGYILRVRRFTALGFSKDDFPIHVFDLPERYGFDGLIGLSFLHGFNYEVLSAEGKILVEPVPIGERSSPQGPARGE